MSKGPWQEGAPYGALKKEVLNAAGRAVATVFVKRYKKTGSPVVWPEGVANLRAIIALPDLIAALKATWDWLNKFYPPDIYTGTSNKVADVEIAELREQARAVLADCGAEMEG